jgi:hypothetical protein
MEVHHHPHVEKKSFKEYLLEGLMIFIAVSMGFIAENIREYIVDSEKEHQYIEAFIKDLRADTTSMKTRIISIQKIENGVDSLLQTSYTDLTKQENAQNFIRFFLMTNGLPIHNPNTSALVQFKNTGSLRLVSYRKGVVDSILKYDSWNERISKHNDFFAESITKAFEAFYPIAEVRIFRDSSYMDYRKKKMTGKPVPPLNVSREKLNIFLGYETRHALICQVNREYLTSQLQRAIRLISFLESEYHLKSE